MRIPLRWRWRRTLALVLFLGAMPSCLAGLAVGVELGRPWGHAIAYVVWLAMIFAWPLSGAYLLHGRRVAGIERERLPTARVVER